MSETDQDLEVTADELTGALAAKGIDAFVHQTGGNTATIYATLPRNIIIVGPGVFNYENPGASVFTSQDLYVGTLAEEDPGIAVTPGATAEKIAEAVIAADR
ncbi:hypothetical protein [Arthrobacter sp. IK3]|uniref:hypothetical protein n=1 Tax=Arthrobacter sp. IK3 TaxID=3448169 RepID=UPI003EE19247